MRNVKVSLLIFFLLAIAGTAMGQRPAFYKMSSLVREACRSAALPVRYSKGADARKMIAFVKLSGTDADVLADKGCKVLARYGSLCIAEIPLTAIGGLSLDKNVLRIEAERGTTALMDTTAIIVNAVPVQEGINLPQGYTGKGVVVGVQDIGFDLTHPTFWSSDMSNYRIKAMWDQLSNDTLTSTLPVGRDYVGQDELLAIEHPRDGLIQTHGTHTTGIAAGSGAEGGGMVSPYRGIAYDADICLVCNATSDDASLIDPKDYYKYTYALDALGFKYIFDYADRVGKPCVINFSEGSRMDFRGDDQLYYEMLDSLTGPGHIIVASAGNLGAQVNYVRKTPVEPSKSIDCHRGSQYSIVTTRTRDDFTFGVTLRKGDTTMSLSIPFNKVLAAEDSTYADSIIGNGIKYKVTASAYESCYDKSDIICDWRIDRDTVNVAEDARWAMQLSLSGDGLVEMFPAVGTFYHRDGTMSPDDNAYSINSPGSAPSVISVGMTGYQRSLTNYLGQPYGPFSTGADNGERNINSSVGPTFDERIKPDVMAPGQVIVSSYNSFCQSVCNVQSDIRKFSYNGRDYFWGTSSGTSMSSPVVAGIIALWLQAYPKLTPADCIDIFSKTCTHPDASLDYPNTLYGYGQIDAKAGIKLVLQKAADGINEIPASRAASADRIYSIDGRYVGTSTEHLSHGLYISHGKKIIVR